MDPSNAINFPKIIKSEHFIINRPVAENISLGTLHGTLRKY